ncbi:MAG: hypothetical protein LC789_16125 [Actinobacteria bacterium]|nr:hypothetical protein [Actinomycetota bacterium]
MREITSRRAMPLVVATMVLLSGCTGGNAGVEELCAVADLPATSPAELQVLQNRIGAVFANGKRFLGTDRNKRVFKAAISVKFSAEHAQFQAELAASGGAGLAPLFNDTPKPAGYNLTDLPKAQADLRAACRG